MTAPKLRVGLLVVILTVLALPGTASAALSVTAESTTVTEAGSARNGVIEGGDTVDVAVELRNTGASALTGIHATLSSTSPVVAVLDQADYPDLDPFDSAAGLTPFRVHLPSVACGESISFTVNATAGGETADIPITVTTGATPAGYQTYTQAAPFPIPDSLPTLHGATLASLVTAGTATSTLSVPIPLTGGRLKDLRVRIPRIDTPNLGHLRILLIAPNNDASVVLLDHRGAGAQVLSGTVFAADGAPLSSGSPPYTGSFRPEGDLTSLAGHVQNGIWKLRIELDDRTEVGQIQGWSLDVKAADCTPRSYAALTVTPAQVAPSATAILDASASVDTEGSDPQYAFDVDGNGSYEVDNGSDPTLPVSFPSHGPKPVGVQLSDGATVIGTATATLAVSQPPTARIDVAGGLTPLSGQTVTFDGTTSNDPEDGTALQHQWSVDGGPYTSGDSLTFDQTFPKKGTHVVSLRVTDLDGASDVAEVTVAVQNQAPTATLALSGPAAARGQVTTFDAGASDPDGTIAHYEWDLDGNGTFETDGGTSPTMTKTYAAVGTFVVGVQVTDDDGDSASDSLSFDVTEPPVVGTLSADPAQPRPGASVTFTLSGASDPDGGTVTYAWSFGDGATQPVGTLSASHSYATAATVNVTVTVTDNEGAQTTATLPLVVSGLAPIAALTATPNPVDTGATVVFDASGSDDPDGHIVGYRWDLDGDGFFERDSGTNPTVSRSYPNAAALTARVRVTDEDGHNTIAAVNLTVQGPPIDPGAGGAGGQPGSSGAGAGAGAGGGAGGGADGSGGGGSDGGGSDDGGSGAGGAAGSARFTAALAAAPIQKLKAVMKAGVAATCKTSRAGRCTVRLELAGADARRLGLSRSKAKAFVLARATVRTHAAKPAKVALKLSRGAVAKLRRAARVTVTVAGEAVDAAGNSASFKRAVLVRNR